MDDADTQPRDDRSKGEDSIENKQADSTNESWTDPDAQQPADAGATHASVNPTNGNYANMAFGGDMNQMQMMMAMQNGMMPNAFAGYPMIGLSCPPRPRLQRPG